jgi:hypothetical protein
MEESSILKIVADRISEGRLSQTADRGIGVVHGNSLSQLTVILAIGHFASKIGSVERKLQLTIFRPRLFE